MERVDHDGRETAYRNVREGAAERADRTVLYVHGSGATHRLWTAQWAPDGPGGEAAALDLSGHGNSADVAAEPGPETLAAYVADVAAVAEAVGADVLVGNSLGGAVVLRGLLDGAVDPAGVVLAGTGAKLSVLDSLREALAEDFPTAVEWLHGPDRLFHDPDPSVRERSRATMEAVGRRVTRRDFETCHRFDVRDRIDAVETPALALTGEHDELTPPASHEYLAGEMPNCRAETVPDAAHLSMVERPAAFNERVSGFLADL